MYDLEEQEQIDTLKSWWKQYGAWVLGGAAIVAVAYASWQGWRYYERTQAEKAGALFEAVRTTAQQGDAAKTLQAAKALQEAQPDSALAPRGALIASAVSHARGDNDSAQYELRWVVEHTREPALADLARLRQAGLLADQKKFDEALHVLEGNHDADFAALTFDLRGDILLAMGRKPEARTAYQGALEKSQTGDVLHQIAQSKLEALGEGK